MKNKTLLFAVLLLLALLTACAAPPPAPAENTPAPEPTPDAAAQESIAMFGSRCVPEYTQQLTLDGFEGEVWFVPYRPFRSYAYAQIMQNGEILAQLNSRSHEGHSGEEFAGLDSVAFRDLNGDGKTDIVMIERFGDESFASLFFSAPGDTAAPEERFYRDDDLEKELEHRAAFCSVPLTAEWASDMVRIGHDGGPEISCWAGEFEDWQTAYRAAAERFELECSQDSPPSESSYALIDVNGDDVPELVSAMSYGYYIRLYTFRGGTLYVPMHMMWYPESFQYRPGENIIRYNVYDILCSTCYYSEIDADGEVHTTVAFTENYFADTNDNGVLDEPIEYDYIDKNGNGQYDYDADELNYTYWLNGEKISREDLAVCLGENLSAHGGSFFSCSGDGYEAIRPKLSYDELMALLDGYGTQ